MSLNTDSLQPESPGTGWVRNKIFAGTPYLALRVILGGIFIWSGTVKALFPFRFAETLSDYGLIPGPMVLPLAFGLTALEIVTGAALLFNIRRSLEINPL